MQAVFDKTYFRLPTQSAIAACRPILQSACRAETLERMKAGKT
jgi:hypothetical protein